MIKENKILTIFFATICIVASNQLICQNIEKVNIYIIPFNVDYLSDRYKDADFVRVRNDFSISSSETSFIRDFENIVTKASNGSVIKSREKEDIFGARIVIDLISSSKIDQSICVLKDKTYYFDTPYTHTDIYAANAELICLLNLYFPQIPQFRRSHKPI